MVTKGKMRGTVLFSVRPVSTAVEVYLAGGFRDWRPLPMRRQRDGSFALEVRLPPGDHEYKFLVDGQWMADPDHGRCAPNPYGSVNSVAKVD
jgi:1,4-alpha-glucan branching enzyme